jgi:glycosyltransferase involved in cell wall biosynthesis
VKTVPSISVIIPAYNAADCISRALDTVLQQTLSACEVIVVDDGSTDNTSEVVRKYPEPVRLVATKNQGPGCARNTGAQIARGDWFAFLDADDGWVPTKLERQASFTADPSVGIVHTRMRNTSFVDVPDTVTFERLWSGNCLGTSSVMIRRAAFFDAGGFALDLAPAEDYYLWLRVASKWKIVTCQEWLTVYTRGPLGISRNSENLARAAIGVLERIGCERGLPEATIQKRVLNIVDECGRSLLWKRDLGASRRWFARGFRMNPSSPRAAYWLATFLPKPVLDANRWVKTRMSPGIPAP